MLRWDLGPLAVGALILAIGAGLALLRRRQSRGERRAPLDAPAPPPAKRYVAPPGALLSEAPTAVLLVSGYTQAGLGMLLEISQTFRDYYRNVVFLSLAPAGVQTPADPREVKLFRAQLEEPLENYVPVARLLGLHAQYRSALGPDELDLACREVLAQYPRACFVLSRVLLPGGRSLAWSLSDGLAESIRSGFVRTRTPFIEMAVSLPSGAVGPAALFSTEERLA